MLKDKAALAQEIAEAVILLAWDWEVDSIEIEAVILKIIMKHTD